MTSDRVTLSRVFEIFLQEVDRLGINRDSSDYRIVRAAISNLLKRLDIAEQGTDCFSSWSIKTEEFSVQELEQLKKSTMEVGDPFAEDVFAHDLIKEELDDRGEEQILEHQSMEAINPPTSVHNFQAENLKQEVKTEDSSDDENTLTENNVQMLGQCDKVGRCGESSEVPNNSETDILKYRLEAVDPGNSTFILNMLSQNILKHLEDDSRPSAQATCSSVNAESSPSESVQTDSGIWCLICRKQFARLTELNRHMKCHRGLGAKPYCCSDCEKSFSNLIALRRHTRFHTGENLLSCEWCGKQFTDSSLWKLHRRIHTGEKPYSCDQCDRKFNQMPSLKRHARIHSGEKPYSCTKCTKRFSQSQNLKRHMVNIHT